MTIDQSRNLSFDLPLAEQGFIGALLVRPGLTGEVGGQVSPEDFLTPRVKHVYSAMLSLWARGIEPTTETIVDTLRAAEVLDLVGGRAELGALIAHADSTYPAKYISAILEHSLRRKINTRLRQALELNADPHVSPVDALDSAKEMLTDIDVPLDCPSEAIDLPTFCAGEDTYDYLVPDLIERGDRILIVAAEGGGKTVLTRQLAVCAAIGVHPFGGVSCEPLRVLMIDLENPPALVRRKLRPMYDTARRLRPYGPHENLTVLCKPGGIDVTKRADARWLSVQLAHTKPDLVVLGPLYKLYSTDDNWEKGARTVTLLLDDLRARMNFGLIMETHAPQAMGGTRHLRPVGSSLWLRWPEFIVTFAPTEKRADIIKVSKSKSRDERYWPNFLRREGPNWPWTPCRDPDTTDAAFLPWTDDAGSEEMF